jgi:hypothetical protein
VSSHPHSQLTVRCESLRNKQGHFARRPYSTDAEQANKKANMARKSTPQPLTLPDRDERAINVNTQQQQAEFIDSPCSPLSPRSPKSPRSPFRFISSKKVQSDQPHMQLPDNSSQTAIAPNIASSQTWPNSQQYPVSSGAQEGQPQPEGRSSRSAKGGFFSNKKASKSSSRLQSSDTTIRQVIETNNSIGISRDSERPALTDKVSSKETKRTGMTTRVSPRFILGFTSDSISNLALSVASSTDRATTRRPVGGPSKSDVSLADSQVEISPSSSQAGIRKNKPKGFNLLSRTRSIRDEQSPRGDASPKENITEPERAHTQVESVRTAPLPIDNERSFRGIMSSSVRQRSEDRQPAAPRDISREKTRQNGRSREQNARTQNIKEQKERTQNSFSSSFREGGGHTFLNNLKNSATKGAGAFSKGLFGKAGRSDSMHEKEPAIDDNHYQLKVLNLPLVEQTRLTRISKRLEDSRDKTEFWMPAFPWRAIDYLNYKGSDVEGLYRVPGSGPEIKKWQRRFDECKCVRYPAIYLSFLTSNST